MPGPAPKHPGTRARRNQTSTRATLRAVPDMPTPALPEHPKGPWHAMTATWWADVWASPMAPEFDASDTHGLYALAMLVDDFWRADESGNRMKLAAEIRQQGQRFGLSPIDRRRLQWEIERTEAAQEKSAVRRERARPVTSAADPRSLLTGG